jgi:uncharacterized LabA/DUF88 family protein
MEYPRVYVYIDGFNLFYGALKHPDRKKYRWLNVEKLIKSIYTPTQKYGIEKINFYTARIVPHSTTDDAPKNQQIYFNALKTINNLNIILGNFIAKPTKFPKYPITTPPQIVQVLKTEEKGSDVNLASHIVLDAAQNNFDIAIVVTNDTDLFEPLRIAKEIFNKKIVLICPHNKIAASFKKLDILQFVVETKHLKVSQFDDVTTKPKNWI